MSGNVKAVNLKVLPVSNVKIKDSFWADRQKVVHDVSIPYQWEALNDNVPGAVPSHAIKNFRIAAGEIDEEFGGRVFQDTDVYKWLEAVGYYLGTKEDPKLEEVADEVIDLIKKAQQPDGYVNTYFTAKAPEQRWTNLRDLHELYCAGHMIEAAVAYFNGTGKRKLLEVACRFADYIESVFGTEPGKKKGYDGHEEIELALVRLYHVTGEKRYLNLSKYFIDERGQAPHFFDIEEEERKKAGQSQKYDYSYYQAHMVEYDYTYHQAHTPVRHQTTADGHAVRAMYLYSGMIDVAAHTGDESLYKACKQIWENIIGKRMYITGGIGSIAHGEAFTFDYDLPNDKAYTETCAAIGLIFFAHRMLRYEVDRKYADVMERVLYNGALSGISLDGRKYFYVNPLEVWPESIEKRKDNYKKRLRATRQEWYGTACCPPNIARLIASFGQYIYSQSGNEIYLHLYAGNETNFEINGQNVSIIQKTNYPWDENVDITVNPGTDVHFTLAIRIPGWCQHAKLMVNNEEVNINSTIQKGYVYLNRVWRKGDEIKLFISMPVERIQSNSKVRVNAGKIALQRGPVVYCLEEYDNGPILTDISIPRNAQFDVHFDDQLLGGVSIIRTNGLRSKEPSQGDPLYKPADYETRPIEITAVPYFAWCNRTPGEMLVWIRE